MNVFSDNTWILRLKINNLAHMLMNAWFMRDTNGKFYLKLCMAMNRTQINALEGKTQKVQFAREKTLACTQMQDHVLYNKMPAQHY